jgi:hypothetical protein
MCRKKRAGTYFSAEPGLSTEDLAVNEGIFQHAVAYDYKKCEDLKECEVQQVNNAYFAGRDTWLSSFMLCCTDGLLAVQTSTFTAMSQFFRQLRVTCQP